MASGMPDYQRIIRPMFGGAEQKAGSKPAVGSAEIDLVTLAGKGMIYGGIVWVDDGLAQEESVIHAVFDDLPALSLSFKRMHDYGITDPGKSIISLNKYDAVGFIYSAGVSYGLTFEKSFRLLYSEGHGFAPTVYYNLVYTLFSLAL